MANRAVVAVVAVVALASCGEVIKQDMTTCTAGTFIECNGGSARFCNDTGDGFEDTACGAPQCNATAKRCNECIPSKVGCNGTMLQSCDADGLPLAGGESCQLACVGETAVDPAHCTFVEPKYLADVCTTKATMPVFAVDNASVSIDTNLDAVCTGGVVTQTQGPAVCVMRYTEFLIAANLTLTVNGTRALAVVTDGPLRVLGTLDIGADLHISGPGGGTVASGSTGGPLANGVGGAGFVQKAGNGGTMGTDGGGGVGGASFSPLSIAPLRGGTIAVNAGGGGGGGAATLISCRGTVTVSGTIDAGGGGGAGRGQFGSFVVGGDGGGAGGYVVLQGLDVNVTGRVFANGGGGGGGGIAGGTPGASGADGTRSATSPAIGGSPGSTAAGGGGDGGRKSVNPGPGKGAPGSGTSGGGGGSIGAFQAYVPTGVTPVLTPTDASPDFGPTLQIPTK